MVEINLYILLISRISRDSLLLPRSQRLFWQIHVERDVCQYVSSVTCNHDPFSLYSRIRVGPMNTARARAFGYIYVCACVRPRAYTLNVRRRLKRSPTSIALAINARLPQPRLFVYPCGTRDSALSTPTCAVLFLFHPRSLFLDPLFHYSTESSGCYFLYIFFSSIGECIFLRTVSSDNSSGHYFRVLPTTHSRFRISLRLVSFVIYFVLKYRAKLSHRIS